VCDFIGLNDFKMFMNENILCKKLRIIAGIENVGKAEYIAKRFLKEWVDVVLSCKFAVKEKILVMKDIDTERIFIHGFCYNGKERGWYRRKIKESLVHEFDKYGDLIFAPEVFCPQKLITDFGMNSNADELTAKIPSAKFILIPRRDHISVVPDKRFKREVLIFLEEN